MDKISFRKPFRNIGLLNGNILGDGLDLGTILSQLIWPYSMLFLLSANIYLQWHFIGSALQQQKYRLHPRNTTVNNSVSAQKSWVNRTVIDLCSLASVQWTKSSTSFTLALRLGIFCKPKLFLFIRTNTRTVSTTNSRTALTSSICTVHF